MSLFYIVVCKLVEISQSGSNQLSHDDIDVMALTAAATNFLLQVTLLSLNHTQTQGLGDLYN